MDLSRYSRKVEGKYRRLHLCRKPKKRTGTNLKEYWASKKLLDTSNNDQCSDASESIDITDTTLKCSSQLETCPADRSSNDIETTHTGIIEGDECILTASSSNMVSYSSFELVGRRIVDVAFFISQIVAIDDHLPFHCSFKDMVPVKELRRGLSSCFTMKCQMCSLEKQLWTDKILNSVLMDVNTAAVSATTSTGGGYAQLEEMVSALDIPCMTFGTFQKYHDKIANGWKQTARQEMLAAAEAEKEEAIKRGEVDTDGIPLLTVVADGCWAKRSYKTNYNSLSGVAAIVGHYTRKVLFIGVKNKYCTLCMKGERTGEPTRAHTCYKNWRTDQSSTSMEAAIITEGFECSEAMYGVRYARVIADGDSSVYKSILNKRPYKNLTIQKIECRNHLLRNYCKKIREIVQTSDNKRYPIVLRKKIGDNLYRLRYAVSIAIKYRKSESSCNKVNLLKEDILNGPSHVFGDHQNCFSRGYFCDGTDKRNQTNLVPALKSCGLFQQIQEAARYISLNAYSLLQDVDSNFAEHYNHAVAKFTGGKRINFTRTRSYEARCEGAVVQHNSGMAHYKLHKTLLGCSPGTFSKRTLMKRKMKVDHDRERRAKVPKIRRDLFLTKRHCDKDYGPNSQRPDLSLDEFKEERNRFLESLKMDAHQRQQLTERTVLQTQSSEWLEERRKRICSSSFGRICKRRPHTSCQSFVRNLLYGRGVFTEATEYGRLNEETALEAAAEATGHKIKKCGLIIDDILPFVAATPDGIIDDGKGIVEIKCPHKIRDQNPKEAAMSGILSFLHVNTDSIIEINKRHDYYYQIQGQLHVSKREYCLLCVWSPKGLEIIRIERDNYFWEQQMEPYIKNFYEDCILPELVDPRHTRSLPIRDPSWIISAQEKLKKLKK